MITDHALMRWFERIDGYDLGPIREAYIRKHGGEPYDGQLLAFGQVYCGLPVNATRARILSPCVRLAVRAGCARIKVGPAVLEVRDGAITTVMLTGRRKGRIGRAITGRPVQRFVMEAAE